jgi:DhnA family fructose-bisphosphate aldolase class Ia
MSFYQPNSHLRFNNIIVQGNIGKGKCLIAAFFQGIHDQERLTENDINNLIREATENMIKVLLEDKEVCK